MPQILFQNGFILLPPIVQVRILRASNGVKETDGGLMSAALASLAGPHVGAALKRLVIAIPMFYLRDVSEVLHVHLRYPILQRPSIRVRLFIFFNDFRVHLIGHGPTELWAEKLLVPHILPVPQELLGARLLPSLEVLSIKRCESQ